MDNNFILPILFVIVVYPLMTVGLSEFQRGLEQRKSPFTRVILQLQLTVLPSLAIYIALSKIAGFDAMSQAKLTELSSGVILAKIVLTTMWIFSINAILTALNAFITQPRDNSSFLANIPGLLLDLLRLMLVLLAAAIIVSTIWGADLQGALVGLGVGGIVLGLALQDTLSAVFAGLSMVSTRTFKEGDWLSVGDTQGQITAMDWRSITLKTETMTLAVVPNSALAQATFVVQSSETQPYGEEIELTFSYDDAPEKVIEIITEVAHSIPDIMHTPILEVELIDYIDQGIKYELMFFVPDRGLAWKVRSDFLRRLWYASNRAGLKLAGSTNKYFQTSKTIKDDSEKCFKHLLGTGLFDENMVGLENLAKSAKIIEFGYHETLEKSGTVSTYTFFPINGTINVIDNDDNILDTLKNGKTFITRQTLTRAPRTLNLRSGDFATVVALPISALLKITSNDVTIATRVERLIELTQNSLKSKI